MPEPIEGAGTAEQQWRAWQWERFPALAPLQLVPPGARAVVVSPHPDDEVLGCGGLLASLAAARDLLLVAVTDGTASHPGSGYWSAARLARARPAETAAALGILGASAGALVRLGIADGQVGAHEEAIAARLRALLRPGDIVFCTWRGDGHPDHEGTGRACARAVQGLPVRLAEFPVWAWHWSTPGDARVPWHRLHRIPLTRGALRLKRRALQAFRSQIEPDPASGAPPVLPGHVLARFVRPFESFLL